MKKFLKILMLVLALTATACAVFAIAFVVEWQRCSRTKSVPEITETEFPEGNHTIAKKIPFTVKIRTSWSLMPVGAVLTPAKGAQEGKPPEIVPGKWGWGTRMWNVRLWIQPFRDGKIEESPVQILLKGGPDGKYTLETKIPSFTAEMVPVSPDSELKIAKEVPIPDKRAEKWFWFAICAIFILVPVIWLLLRKRGKRSEPKIPVWVQALNAITELREKLLAGRSTPEHAVVRLTDVVRNFLEKQFSLRAEHQTTSEFLDALRSGESPLDREQRRFLKDFLSSADMVKFAKLPADKTLFENAAGRAESLIRSTAEEQTGKEERS